MGVPCNYFLCFSVYLRSSQIIFLRKENFISGNNLFCGLMYVCYFISLHFYRISPKALQPTCSTKHCVKFLELQMTLLLWETSLNCLFEKGSVHESKSQVFERMGRRSRDGRRGGMEEKGEIKGNKMQYVRGAVSPMHIFIMYNNNILMECF